MVDGDQGYKGTGDNGKGDGPDHDDDDDDVVLLLLLLLAALIAEPAILLSRLVQIHVRWINIAAQ
jgi:hypothetical protein